MTTPGQRCARIADALGDLAAQEEASLQRDDFAAVAAIQERAAPLVEFLGENFPSLSGADVERVRPALGAVFDRRARTARLLDEKISGLRHALAETTAARGRAARIGPAYGARHGAAGGRTLLAQG